VSGLTPNVKCLLVFVVILPRVILTGTLLWLGTRFLTATNDFSELVLNTVGLEFIILFKNLTYHTVVPDRNKRELQNIEVRPSTAVEYANYFNYLGTFGWAVVAMAWNVYYVFMLQDVLPQYRWDVGPFCGPWFEKKYAVAM